MNKILLIGQCSLHLGRMEFGNIGNYYIIEPFIRELRRVFPNSSIKTTFQMSDSFVAREDITVLPIELYYDFDSNQNMDLAKQEYEIAKIYNSTNKLLNQTPYIKEVFNSDLVIDFSGDIWGDNADMLGQDRFLTGLYKNRVAQLLGVKTVMLAGSPGPFANQKSVDFAKTVYKNMNLVTTREPLSLELLERNWGFDVSNTRALACPAFLFEASVNFSRPNYFSSSKPVIGFVICGWNFQSGPYNKKNRDNSEFIELVEYVEYLSEKFDAQVCLISHSNGFDPNDKNFTLTHGADYELTAQLYDIIMNRGRANNILLYDEILSAWDTKALISHLDMLVSGRIHGAVAGLSQSIPTVMLNYKHGPAAHKIRGFAKVCQCEQYVAEVDNPDDTKLILSQCFNKRDSYKHHLNKIMPEVKMLAKDNFNLLKQLNK
ncbi:polysaccharide pyruvyl transferase family protein [bacterium]|nr:polysaccharide pyruvyl transferase family protein [bacterium]